MGHLTDYGNGKTGYEREDLHILGRAATLVNGAESNQRPVIQWVWHSPLLAPLQAGKCQARRFAPKRHFGE